MSLPAAELVSYLDSLDEPHILLDPQYRILAANRAYLRDYGTGASVVGRHCHEVSHHFDRPCDQAGESCPMAQARVSGQRERVLHLHHTPQGEAYVNIELAPLRNAQGQQVFFIEKMEELKGARSAGRHEGLVGRSAPFRDMLELVARVGPSSATVLLLGESGTGKELVARAVHAASERAQGPLVVVECASLSDNLFESELFGHERGAFTGASSSKPGLVEAASGGTLFLDEVGDIPLPMQVKLLRLLESGTYRRVGSTELRRSDIRVVAATHRDLHQMIAQGQFREDLYHRISVFPIHLPSLRERSEDIPLLAHTLLARVAPERTLSLSPQAVDVLCKHPFAGNVRELRNVLERSALLCDGDLIETQHVLRALQRPGTPLGRTAPGPASAGSVTQGPSPAPLPSGQTLKDMERAMLQAHLAQHAGSRADLARRLGISPRTLYRRLKELGLEGTEPG